MKVKQNLHTHSSYDDGKDSIEASVLSALDKGFTSLGFSGHGTNWPLDGSSMTSQATQDYIRDVRAMQEKYKDQIEIYCGIEQDSMSRLDTTPYDYVIGSVHFLQKGDKFLPVDNSPNTFKEILEDFYHGDIQQMVREYYRYVGEQAYWPEVDIIGHVDLISKYNENEEFFPFEADWYLKEAYKAIDQIIEQGKILEMNTGAISRGVRKTPYPHQSLLNHIHEKGGKICLNTDCHNKDWLDVGMADCLERAKKAGFDQIWINTKEGFAPVPIEDFQV